MRKIDVGQNEKGQRLDKLLKKYLKEANSGFIYKMLRKKNIVLNGKKADGTELLNDGDEVKMFFSEETFDIMTGQKTGARTGSGAPTNLSIVYEDEHILLVNKPSGMLSQSDQSGDGNINDQCLSYLRNKGELTDEQLQTFKPGIANRLDRNTSGIMIFGKTLPSLQVLAKIIKDRSICKYYIAVVKGEVKTKDSIHAYLKKDEKTNKVDVSSTPKDDYVEINTAYEPERIGKLADGTVFTVLRVHLITGKTHQIRAHLSSIGHPILGDPKYGDKKLNAKLRSTCNVHSQLLHAYELIFPDMSGTVLSELSGKSFKAEPDKSYDAFIKR